MASVAASTTEAVRTVRGDNLSTAVSLSKYATSRAVMQSRNGTLTHDGLQCVYPTRKSCGEILGAIDTNDPIVAITQVIATWLRSPHHRSMLLDKSWRWFGVGVTHKDGRYFFAIEFAK